MRERYHCTNRITTGLLDYTIDLFFDLEFFSYRGRSEDMKKRSAISLVVVAVTTRFEEMVTRQNLIIDLKHTQY